MFANIRADIARISRFKELGTLRALIESLLFDNGFNAVLLYRIAHWFKIRGIPFIGPLFGRISVILTGAEIAPGAEFGPGLMVSHGYGIVVGQWARVGANATLLHQVTLGGPSMSKLIQMPMIGENVFIGAGAKVIGGITIGDDVFIGVDAVVTEDIPSGSKVIQSAGIEVLPPMSAPPEDDSQK